MGAYRSSCMGYKGASNVIFKWITMQNAFFISFCTHGLRFFEIIFILYNIPVKCTRAKRIEMIVQAHTGAVASFPDYLRWF